MPEAQPRLDITELPYASDPAHHFAALRQRPGAVLLDSGRPAAPGGRFDILTSDPLYTLSVDDAGVHGDDSMPPLSSEPFAAQRELLAHALRHDLPQIPDALASTLDELPFIGGLLGYWSYTLARAHQPQSNPPEPRPGPDLPHARLGLYDWALIQDHQAQRSWLVASLERRRQVERWLATPPPQGEDIALTQPFTGDIDRAGYGERFRRVIDYLHAGDCYQVNLAQRFTARFRGDTWHAYRRLRQATPTPYGGYLRWDDKAIASLSPERFVRVTGGQVETRPIKGTRARGETPQADAALAQALQESPKDRAENVMIVDLLRNDLGRVCRFGSVHVPHLCALESYANVHHLVSVVRGELRPEASALDLLAAAFPGGSITGAPKRRAMQIIDELEPSQRSVYCGSLGYVDRRGHLDTSIAIRTLVADGDTLHLWGGGGVVADSDEEEEYRETLAKIGRLMAALGPAGDDRTVPRPGAAEGPRLNNQNI
ncbi:aminodeoxychorismate synthase component I [Salinicola endophyticus]|uniref:aminodeoxychorismate synthase n=1 Tax=Salinicola endophyticus TaxID=1949083 RepID=A0ABY8FKB7_9GAMM|nr:aminodeoxychorismate synthase component I [Salinicola endophyticus]WFF43249.1 aminodeoxychorismate synthase component I [Salinicola endophyticus]